MFVKSHADVTSLAKLFGTFQLPKKKSKRHLGRCSCLVAAEKGKGR
jgi:hypothetical protein